MIKRPAVYPKKYDDMGKILRTLEDVPNSSAMLERFGTSEEAVKPETNLKSETVHVVKTFRLLGQFRASAICSSEVVDNMMRLRCKYT